MTREELLALEGQKVALTAQAPGTTAKIAYHGVILKVSEKGVIMGMGSTKTPTPVLIEHVTTCVAFADQSTYVKGQRS